MLLFPEAQKKAQQELDAVVGSDTLPSHGHLAGLPYLNAVAKETLRWLPV
nr:geraniol 8-hydroxylase-like [Tanacetum cinerariifolium]